MQNEKIIEKEQQFIITIKGNKIASFQEIKQQFNVVKVYENGLMGKAIGFGEDKLSALTEKAVHNLKYQINYPGLEGKETNQTETLIMDNLNILETQLLTKMKQLLEQITLRNPNFLFNNKIYLLHKTTFYENSNNLKYLHQIQELDFALTIKHKQSANIIDFTYMSTYYEKYNDEGIINDLTKLCEAFQTKPVELPSEVNVICPISEIIYQVVNDLRSDVYFSGASLFNNKLGEQVFNEQVNLLIDQSNGSYFAFFDDEGEVGQNHQTSLVQDGVLQQLFATRKQSKIYGIPSSKNAKIDENGLIGFNFDSLTAKTTHPSFQEVLGAEEGIYLVVTSGTSILPGGDFNIPVSLALKYQAGKIVGKIESFNLSGNIFQILNQDFLGITNNSLFSSIKEKYLIFKLRINDV